MPKIKTKIKVEFHLDIDNDNEISKFKKEVQRFTVRTEHVVKAYLEVENHGLSEV